MRALKKFYFTLVTLFQKKSIERNIKKYDSLLNIKTDGYFFYEGMIAPPELPKPTQFDDCGINMSRNISSEIGQVVSSTVEKLKPDIISYLGPDVRLDDITLFWYDPQFATKDKSVSGSWHNDNVGHRMKLFICLKGNGNTPTVLEPGTNKKPYRFHLKELFRFLGFADTKNREGEIFLRYKSGDVALFDTNAEHRGYYEEPASERAVVVVEFANRKKSNEISGRAPCGPGSCPSGKVLFSKPAYDAILKTGLIDTNIIKIEKDFVSYSISNALTH